MAIHYSFIKDVTETENANAQKRHSVLSNYELETFEQKIQSLQKKLKDQEKIIDTNNKRKEEIDSLNKKIASCEKEIESLKAKHKLDMQTEKNKGNETFQEDLTKIGQEIKDKEDQITFMQKNNSAMLAENMRLKKLEKQIKGGHDAMKQFDKELNDWKSRAEKAEFDVKQLNSQIKHHASKRTSEVPFVNSGVPLEPEVKKKENQISLIAELANKNAGGTAGKELLKEKEDHQ